MKTFVVFACAGLVWVWVLPIWQGPDETAHFAYVQYMQYHLMPPKEEVLSPGLQPWMVSTSTAANLSKELTQYYVAENPSRHMEVSFVRRQAVLAHIRRASTVDANMAGSQNYVGIYPPLYYGVAARLLSFLHVKNVNDQAYIARLCSVFIFGVFGTILDTMLSRLLPQRDWRGSLVDSVPFLFPTLAMLGGVVNNDILMDTMCLALYCVILDALRRDVWTTRTVVVYGIVFGLAFVTKPDTYAPAVVAGLVVITRLWRTIRPRREIISFITMGAVPVLAVAGPWFVVAARYYHSVIPPLTYQAAGGWPRNAHWFMTHLFASSPYQMSVMVYQTVSGINFPWWVQPVQSQAFYNVWIVVVCGLMADGVYRLMRSDMALFGVSLAWLAVVFAFLWYIAYTYLLKTGTHFLQGRYFFMMLPVVLYLLALALNRKVYLLRLLPMFSAFVFLTVLHATIERYYGRSLLAMVGGRVITYDPTPIINLGRISLGVLCAVWVWNTCTVGSMNKEP